MKNILQLSKGLLVLLLAFSFQTGMARANEPKIGVPTTSFNRVTLIPNAPTNLVATAGVNAATISFTPNLYWTNVTSYQYTLDDGATWTTIATTTSPLQITGLTACTTYSIKIRAVNIANNPSATSAAVTVTPQNGQQAGIKWSRGTSAADNVWTSVTYGNGLYVAVALTGTGNRVMTSPDGITWTIRTSAANNSWNSVTYGNGIFVAVASDGSGNRVMTSPDGITWTSRTSAADNSWNSVTYGNGFFVAVARDGSDNRVMTSPDGNTWTIRTSAANNIWYNVTYGNGLFVAVARDGIGNGVMTSTDGITWTSRTPGADKQWHSVTYGNGLFVAISGSGGGNQVMTSPDGFTWTIITTADDFNALSYVTYGNGLFAVIDQESKIWTSIDGVTWTLRQNSNNSSQSLTYGNGKFVSVSYSGTGNRVMTSSDAFAPSSPTINSITPTSNSASVTFSAPTSIGFSAISNYEYSKDNGSTWVTPSPAVTTSPLNITGLTSSTTYPILLRAVNSVGSSCASATVSATTLTAAPTASAQIFCAGKTVTDLVATGTNLQWYDVATGGTVLATSTALASGTYYVSQTVNSIESARTSVAVTVNTTPAPTASAQTFCNGATVVNLVATHTSLSRLLGPRPPSYIIKWYDVATNGTALVTSTVLATGTYYVSQTDNGCESARTSVAVTVNTTPAPTASAQTFCNGATVANLVATHTSLSRLLTPPSYIIKWYDVATNGTALVTSTVLSTGTYYVSQTDNGCESVRTSVAVTVNTTPAPTASAQTFCGSATVANLVPTNTNPARLLFNQPSYKKWYDTATGGSSLSTSTALATGTYYVSQTLNSCESARTSVAVTVNTTPAPTASAQTFCTSGTVADLIATGTGIKWYTVLTNGTALATSTALATGTYYVSQTLNSCESTRTSVAVTVNTTPAPTASAQTFCGNATVANLVPTNTNINRSLNPPSYKKWYDTATGGSSLSTSTALATGTYYVSQTDNGCESVRTLVAVTVNNSVAGTVPAGQLIVRGTKPAAISLTGSVGTVQWQVSLGNSTFKNIVGATSSTLTSDQMGVLTSKKFYRAFLSTSCNSATSEVVQVWTTLATKIQASQCGQTLASLSNKVEAIGVPGADKYRFKVVQGETTKFIVTSVKGFNLNSLEEGFLFNTTYTISVATQSIGLWSDYGPECSVTTPIAGLTKIQTTQCGTRLASLSTAIYANDVTGATGYRFKVVANGTEEIFDKAVRYFSLTSLTGGTFFDTAYTISVATKYNGVWGDYGDACIVSTPTGKTKIQDSQCETTLASLSTAIYANAITSATGYRFKVVANGATRTIDTASRTFRLTSLLGGALNNTTYTISVATRYNGKFGENYGAECTISTPTVIVPLFTKQSNPAAAKETSSILVKVYPNPYLSNFKLNFSSSSDSNVEVSVYDMIGRHIESRKGNSSEINNLELGRNYPSGVYNIVVTQGTEVKTLRVIKE